MIKVEFFGLYRLSYGVAHIDVEATDVKDLFNKLYEFNPVYSVKDLKNSLIFVNGKNIMSLKKYRTKFTSGDIVFVMSPASGG